MLSYIIIWCYNLYSFEEMLVLWTDEGVSCVGGVYV